MDAKLELDPSGNAFRGIFHKLAAGRSYAAHSLAI